MIDNIIKKIAHNKVKYAVVTGTLTKPDKCQMCGTPAIKMFIRSNPWTNEVIYVVKGRLVAHHENYDKPLEVIWLCRRCHYLKHHGSDYGTI